MPTLRFPGFTDEWKSVKLGDITVNFSKRNKSQLDYPMYSVTNNRGFIPQNEQFEDREMVGEDLKAYKIIEHGEFAYNPARINVGSIAKYDGIEPCMISSLYVCFRTTQNVDGDWLMQYLKSPKANFYYNANGEGGVRIYLFYPNFARIRTAIPSLNEQQKIAGLLRLLDERIEIQSKIIERLESLIGGIREKMFCSTSQKYPIIRPNGFSSDYTEVRLGDICDRITTKNMGLQSTKVLTIAAQYGLISQEDFFNKSVASADLSNYYLLQSGDFAYNKSYSGEYTWGAIKRLDLYGQGVLSPLYICFRPKSDKIYSDYLCAYFESKKWHNEISNIAGEGARNHGLLNISISDFFDTKHKIPNIEEQIEVTRIMKSLTEKLASEERLRGLFQSQKRYLLNALFI